MRQCATLGDGKERGGRGRSSLVSSPPKWPGKELQVQGTHLGSLLRMAAAGELGLMFFTGLCFT